ncbi:MAG TPA: PAS domain-containing protein, partial [Methanomicrobiales archaeon]|nr:PAS domain-containing protein [Methanomicrobiales archaeon]
MKEVEEIPQRILKLLKFRPKGMTIAEIAREAGINRNTAAKQLEILQVNGQVELREFGTAKVYYRAQRVPLSAFLCFTKNLILVLDSNQTIVQVNDQCLRLAGREKEDLLGRSLAEANLPVVSTPEAITVIEGLEKEQIITDLRHQHDGKDLFFQMQVIPTTFEDGGKGCTLVLEDITERKRYVRNMEFLARTAMELVDLPSEADIYQYIAEKVVELLPYPQQCYVESFDEVNRQFFIRVMLNQDFREKGWQIVGQDVVGMVFPIEEFFFKAPFNETIETFRPLREYHFKPFFEDEQYSMYEVCIHQIPKEVCDELVRRLGIGRMYQIGLVWQEQLYGIIGIFMPPENELEDKEVFES